MHIRIYREEEKLRLLCETYKAPCKPNIHAYVVRKLYSGQSLKHIIYALLRKHVYTLLRHLFASGVYTYLGTVLRGLWGHGWRYVIHTRNFLYSDLISTKTEQFTIVLLSQRLVVDNITIIRNYHVCHILSYTMKSVKRIVLIRTHSYTTYRHSFRRRARKPTFSYVSYTNDSVVLETE